MPTSELKSSVLLFSKKIQKCTKPHEHIHNHGRQTGLKSGGAEWNFDNYLVKLFSKISETKWLRDYKTQNSNNIF